MSTKGIRAMIKRFEETGKLVVQPGRGRKRVTPVLVDGVKTAVETQSQTSELGAVARVQILDRQVILTASSEKYSENIMHCFLYIIRRTQELLDRDKLQRLSFEINYLNRMSVDLSWPWNSHVERRSPFLPQ
ncbi:hypothetical protein TNCV_4398381 [Trichonephila clavipes]|nr:hypothetical protein TNCV_4398381 [Trichonephila clavipes]